MDRRDRNAFFFLCAILFIFYSSSESFLLIRILSSSSLLLLSNSLPDVPQPHMAANQASTTITQHPVSTWVTLPHLNQTAANCHASALFFSLVADDNRLKQGADYPSNLCPRDCSHALFLRIHGWLKKNAMPRAALRCASVLAKNTHVGHPSTMRVTCMRLLLTRGSSSLVQSRFAAWISLLNFHV